MNSNNPENNVDTSSLEQNEDKKDDVENQQRMTSASTPDIPSFGWSEYAERVNGRFAMIGFMAIVIIELFSSSHFLQWAGLVP